MGNQISVIVPDEIRAKAKRAGLNISAECREHLKAKIEEYEKKYGRIPMDEDLVIEDLKPVIKDSDLVIEPSPESVFNPTEALSQITINKV
jgi:3-hydroxyacyl-CoA dehydrogenase